ncbi:MAG: hypothetical protein PSU94_00725 [Lacunisphaera sp.]|nr:hypothetical protein [Lacunisphaera sp.]
MLYYLIAAVVVLHTAFWGIGLSWLVLPRVWRRWWWAFAPGLGIALQSAVVWLGAHTPLAGTNVYAQWSELLPLGLLVAAVARHGAPAIGTRLRAAWSARGLLLLAGLAGAVLLWPMAQRGGWTLTASSLGSCDQADYAAGARVLGEFSRDDRTGFLGLSEVTKVGSADYFFDFWLRLNHFTPSALLAHNGTILGLQPYQLVSLTGVVLLLLNSCLVLLLARVAVGLRGSAALIPAALYLFSPLGAYAVHHGALGQLYAAHGIAVLTLAVLGAWRAGLRGGSVWAWAPLVLVAIWILAGSYNFILTVALAPAGAWLLAELWARRDWRGSARVAGLVLAMLAVSAVLFWGRFDGLIERFRLFDQYDFGWPVPLLSPEGWFGMLRDTELHAWPRAVRLLLSALTVGIWLTGVILLWRRQRDRALAAVALVLPVLAGWGLLVWEARTRANASYDAFKLFSVFYPELLAGLTCWLAVAWPARPTWWRRASLALVALVLVLNGHAAGLFARKMALPPLRVERSLLEIRRLERIPRVTSVNLRIEDFWARLWANAFLLRKPQYFSVHTYEGRLNTAFKGEWDLSDSLLRSLPLREADFIDLNPQFHAVRVKAPGRVDLAFGSGWHVQEAEGINRWRWSAGPATITVFNPGARPQTVNLALRVRALQPGRLQLELGDARLGGPRLLNGNLQRLEYKDVVLPPGASVLILSTDQAAAHAADSDPRLLAVALYGLSVQAEP